MKKWIQVVVLFLLHHIPNDPSIALCDTWWSREVIFVSWSSHYRVGKPGMCGTLHAPTSMVVRVIVSGLLYTLDQLFVPGFFPLHCIIRCGIVSFTILSKPSHLGKIEVRTRISWEVHWEGKFLLVSARTLRTLSCLCWSRATWQLFNTCIKVCLSPQSCQAAVSVFPQRCRLALWGKVATAALRTNCIYWDGRDWMVFAHTSISFSSTDAIIWPCFSSFFSCDSLSVLSFSCGDGVGGDDGVMDKQ